MTQLEKSLATIARKAAAVAAMLADPESNRAALIRFIADSYSFHKSGKIEDIFSLDVASRKCSFCDAMREAAKANPAIICKYCYARQEHESAQARHEITGNILQTIRITPEEAAYITPPTAAIVRFNSDGEILNDIHADNLLTIAKATPNTTFAIWTKRPELLNKAITRAGGKPENLIAGISSPQINVTTAPYSWTDFVFTVYTPAGITRALARDEFPCNGKKCKECGFRCYRKPANTAGPVYVAEALRKPHDLKKAEFIELCKTIDEITLKEDWTV